MVLPFKICQHYTCSAVCSTKSWFLDRWRSVTTVAAHLLVSNLFLQMLTESGFKSALAKTFNRLQRPSNKASRQSMLTSEIDPCSCPFTTPFVLQDFSPVLQQKLKPKVNCLVYMKYMYAANVHTCFIQIDGNIIQAYLYAYIYGGDDTLVLTWVCTVRSTSFLKADIKFREPGMQPHLPVLLISLESVFLHLRRMLGGSSLSFVVFLIALCRNKSNPASSLLTSLLFPGNVHVS